MKDPYAKDRTVKNKPPEPGAPPPPESPEVSNAPLPEQDDAMPVWAQRLIEKVDRIAERVESIGGGDGPVGVSYGEPFSAPGKGESGETLGDELNRKGTVELPDSTPVVWGLQGGSNESDTDQRRRRMAEQDATYERWKETKGEGDDTSREAWKQESRDFNEWGREQEKQGVTFESMDDAEKQYRDQHGGDVITINQLGDLAIDTNAMIKEIYDEFKRAQE